MRAPLGLNLQKARRQRGVSQEEPAHLAKVHQTYLSGGELEKRNPSIMVLDRIASVLGLDIADLTKK